MSDDIGFPLKIDFHSFLCRQVGMGVDLELELNSY